MAKQQQSQDPEEEYRVLPVMPYENAEDMVHQPPYYVCAHPECKCHENQKTIDLLSEQVYTGELTPDEAMNILTGRSIHSLGDGRPA